MLILNMSIYLNEIFYLKQVKEENLFWVDFCQTNKDRLKMFLDEPVPPKANPKNQVRTKI